MYDIVNPQILHSKDPEKFLPIKNEFRRPFAICSVLRNCLKVLVQLDFRWKEKLKQIEWYLKLSA